MTLTSTSLTWSPQVLRIWGKTDIETGNWLPLVTHLEDAARVMDYMWEQLPPSVVTLFTDWFASAANARAYLSFLAGVHDVGKASTFQLKARLRPGSETLPDFAQLIAEVGISLPQNPDIHVRHGAVGQVVLEEWLKQEYGIRPLSSARIAGVVGGHHGVNPTAHDAGTPCGTSSPLRPSTSRARGRRYFVPEEYLASDLVEQSR